MNVRTFDSRYAPQGGVEVTLEIQNLELGKGEVQSETLVSDEQGSVRFVFSPQSAGTYTWPLAPAVKWCSKGHRQN